MSSTQPLRRLPLKATKNTRDIGGYPCPGGLVHWGQFFRSDCPQNLEPEDIAYLKTRGVQDVIDLRREDEARHYPSSLAGRDDFRVNNISLTASFHDLDIEGDVPGSMAGLYIRILEDAQSQMRDIMKIMASAPGGVLFHCAVGKDRTGVVAMLLLKLAGVSDEDVVADYAITDIYMREAFSAQQIVFHKTEIPDYVLRSRPESMERVLRHLKENYGTAAQYLQACGMSPEELSVLAQRLTQAAPPAP